MKDDKIKSVPELVRSRSVSGESKPRALFGEGPVKARAYILEIAKMLGFKTWNVTEYGIRGKMIGVLGHVDVVPEGAG